MLVQKKRIPFKHLILIGFLPSPLKKLIYRLKGYKIDGDVDIGFGSIIEGKSVTIGEGCKIGYFTIIISKSIHIGRY